GVLLDGKEPADEGAPVYRDGKKVGVVTCAMYSPLVEKSMGIARLDVDCAVKDARLEIRNRSGAINATAQPLPF
ncbi:MAG: aminomethyl transferase family protein, partial [Mesorhizobium sp.]